jgi:hypothetical protein
MKAKFETIGMEQEAPPEAVVVEAIEAAPAASA